MLVGTCHSLFTEHVVIPKLTKKASADQLGYETGWKTKEEGSIKELEILTPWFYPQAYNNLARFPGVY